MVSRGSIIDRLCGVEDWPSAVWDCGEFLRIPEITLASATREEIANPTKLIREFLPLGLL